VGDVLQARAGDVACGVVVIMVVKVSFISPVPLLLSWWCVVIGAVSVSQTHMQSLATVTQNTNQYTSQKPHQLHTGSLKSHISHVQQPQSHTANTGKSHTSHTA
jgi:hypothetical protein